MAGKAGQPLYSSLLHNHSTRQTAQRLKQQPQQPGRAILLDIAAAGAAGLAAHRYLLPRRKGAGRSVKGGGEASGSAFGLVFRFQAPRIGADNVPLSFLGAAAAQQPR